MNEMSIPSEKTSWFSLRVIIAIILFCGFIILDSTNISIFSVDASEIYVHLQENYTLNSFAFIEEITYTLTHG